MHQLGCQFCVTVTVGHQSLQPGLQRRQKNKTFLKLDFFFFCSKRNINNKLEGEHMVKSARHCILSFLISPMLTLPNVSSCEVSG